MENKETMKNGDIPHESTSISPKHQKRQGKRSESHKENPKVHFMAPAGSRTRKHEAPTRAPAATSPATTAATAVGPTAAAAPTPAPTLASPPAPAAPAAPTRAPIN